MKKLLILPALAVVALLAGCGSSDQPADTSTKTFESEACNKYWEVFSCSFQKEGEAQGLPQDQIDQTLKTLEDSMKAQDAETLNASCEQGLTLVQETADQFEALGCPVN